MDLRLVLIADSPAVENSTGWLFVASCLLLPVVWGVLVHYLFRWFAKRGQGQVRDDWPDYQI